MYWPNLKSVALPVREIIGVPKIFWQSLYTPMLPFPQTFNEHLLGWTLLLFWPNLKSVALPVPEIMAIGDLGLGEEKAIWVWNGTVGKSVGEFL